MDKQLQMQILPEVEVFLDNQQNQQVVQVYLVNQLNLRVLLAYLVSPQQRVASLHQRHLV